MNDTHARTVCQRCTLADEHALVQNVHERYAGDQTRMCVRSSIDAQRCAITLSIPHTTTHRAAPTHIRFNVRQSKLQRVDSACRLRTLHSR
jgi:mRNA-degrading endonuclease toxin of MazEF toxin-antitoxin module